MTHMMDATEKAILGSLVTMRTTSPLIGRNFNLFKNEPRDSDNTIVVAESILS